MERLWHVLNDSKLVYCLDWTLDWTIKRLWHVLNDSSLVYYWDWTIKRLSDVLNDSNLVYYWDWIVERVWHVLNDSHLVYYWDWTIERLVSITGHGRCMWWKPLMSWARRLTMEPNHVFHYKPCWFMEGPPFLYRKLLPIIMTPTIGCDGPFVNGSI